MMQGDRRDTALIDEEARFVVLTGLSGSGKSAAIRALEDLGYFCVENLPTSLIASFADLAEHKGGRIKRAAVVVDMRDPEFLSQFPVALKHLRQRKGLGAVVIFLEASDAALVRRFSETRRPHPAGTDLPLLEGIVQERQRLDGIRSVADKVFDTSDLTVHELRRVFTDLSRGGPEKQLVVTLLSFGYKYGVPLEADLLLDVRFLPNPHFVPDLRPLTGRDRKVQEYVNAAPSTHTFLEKTTDLLRFLIPEYAGEGKSYLTTGIGCTGGRHRSVMIVERLRRRLARIDGVRLRVKHRDIFAEDNRGGT
jgi:UPF0042 nucleotide-binding protein